ncbi:protein HP-25 1 precursor-like protein [Camelus ferus]|nr:protein HP-25 1 precursor-like protein [Camelus ferus]
MSSLQKMVSRVNLMDPQDLKDPEVFQGQLDFQPIVFQEALYNCPGHFDLATGVFTCHVPGVYHFGFDIALSQNVVKVGLLRNATQIRDKQAEAKDGHEHASGSSILQLEKGDRVWLESMLDKEESGKGTIQTVFYGFLINGN